MSRFFDNIYCINLPHRTDRKQHIENELHKLNEPNYKIVSAVDGTKIYDCRTKPPQGCQPLSLGNLGLLKSNEIILKDAIDSKHRSICIIEDDAEFDSKEKITEYLSYIPRNWDMIYFGGNHVVQPTKLDSHISKCNVTFTTHAVIIRNTMFHHILHKVGSYNLPIDVYYTQLQNYYNVYCPNEKLAWQLTGYSDIENREIDYTKVLR